jgi:hypothetical protein
VTPTETPNIQPGLRVFSNSSQLKAAIQTLIAEKTINSLVDGRVTSSERWRIVYRQPDDCLFQVFDAKSKLVRSKFFHGSTLTVAGGSIHQIFQTPSPEAWKKVLDFFELRTPGSSVKDSRQLSPGLWVPNSFEYPVAHFKSKLGIHATVLHSITFVSLNENVDAEFSSGGH